MSLAESAPRINERPYMYGLEDLEQHFASGAGSFDGYVPADVLTRDNHLPFKPERTRWLINSFEKTRNKDGWGNGQDSPLLTAFIIGEDTPSVDVYDGLHRQLAIHIFQEEHGIEAERPPEAIEALGSRAIAFVTVKPMTRRDMLEKRLENTGNHPELRSSRGGLWVSQLWYLDEVSNTGDISAKEAFKLSAQRQRIQDGLVREPKNGIGNRLGLVPEQTNIICDWADDHTAKWGEKPATVVEWISQTESVNPSVIARMRNVGKGKDSRGYFTPPMVNVLGKRLQGEQFWPAQKLLAEFTVAAELNTDEFKILLRRLETETPILKDPANLARVDSFLHSIDTSDIDQTKTASSPASQVNPSMKTEGTTNPATNLEEAAELAWEDAIEGRPTETFRTREEIEIPRDQIDINKAAETLTKRELEVLQAIADGLSTQRVSETLFASPKTIKNHLGSIYTKLGAGDRTEAILRGLMAGAISVGPKEESESVDSDGYPQDPEDGVDTQPTSLNGQSSNGQNGVNVNGSTDDATTQRRRRRGEFVQVIPKTIAGETGSNVRLTNEQLLPHLKGLLPRIVKAYETDGWSEEETQVALDISLAIAELVTKTVTELPK